MGRGLVILVLFLFGCQEAEPEPDMIPVLKDDEIVWELEGNDERIIWQDEDATIYKLIAVDSAEECWEGFGPIVIELQPPNSWRTIEVDCGKIKEDN